MKERTLMRNPWTFVAGASLVLALAGCASAPKEQSSDASAPDSLVHVPLASIRSGEIVVAPAEEQPLADSVVVSGQVAPRPQDVAHVSTRVAGAIQTAQAVIGDHVRKGDVLATLFSPEFSAAQGDYLLAHERAEGALGRGADSSLAGIARSARQRLALMGADEADLARLDRTHEVIPSLPLRSPITGVLTEAEAATGRQVTAGTDLFGIADLRTVWAVVSAFERDLGRLHVNQPASLSATAFPGEEFRGRIASLEGSVKPDTRTLDVRLELANTNLKLRPGMFVTARIATGTSRRAILLSEDAVQSEGDEHIVFVATSDTTFVSRRVAVRPLGGGRVEIAQGLRPGERVAVKGAFVLRSQASKSQLGED
jgi:RND family efflux transporter MFP subunit